MLISQKRDRPKAKQLTLIAPAASSKGAISLRVYIQIKAVCFLFVAAEVTYAPLMDKGTEPCLQPAYRSRVGICCQGQLGIKTLRLGCQPSWAEHKL
jgi:hypothetical protein